MALNKVMLIGNCGSDPDVRDASGAKVATLSLATTEKHKDRNGEWKEQTEWHRIVVWRSTADFVEKYVKKGMQLFIDGRLHTREWTDRDGNKRMTTDVVVDHVQILGQKSSSGDAESAF